MKGLTRLLALVLPAAGLLLAVSAAGGEPAAARRLTVFGEGVVRLSRESLAAWGLAAAKGSVYVYTDGRALDYRLVDGAVEFYAAPYEGLYARERAFLVSNRPLAALGASGEIVKTEAKSARGAVRSAPASYLEVCHLEEDQFYMSGLPGAAPGEEHWFYAALLTPGGRLQLSAELSGPLAPGPGRLVVALRGVTDMAGVDPNHSVAVNFNGTRVGEAIWGGLVRKEAVFELPAGLAVEGANTVELVGQSLPGVSVDLVAVDWVEVSYPRRLLARGDRLNFSVATMANQRVVVEGFSGREVVGFDVTDPSNPRLVVSEAVKVGEGWRAQWVAPAAGVHRYALAGPGGRLSPGSQRSADPWTCRAAEGFNYLIVTHADYRAAADRLAKLHAGHGLRPRVFEAEKVYDAFGCGQPVPEAIRAMVRATRPKYLCLVGDATGDPRGLMFSSTVGTLPCYFAQGPYFETASDNLFGCTEAAGEYPSVAVGRIPARSLAEAQAVVDKLAPRLSGGVGASGEGVAQAALVVGDNDQDIFLQGAGEIAKIFKWGTVDEVLFSGYAAPAGVRAAIVAGWARQPRYFVYFGHAASDCLGKGQELRLIDVPSLDAGDELPAGVILACLAGFYSFSTGADSLAERLLKEPGRGACTLVAPSGMSPPEGQVILGREIARALADGRAVTLGQALVLAKRRMPAEYLDVLRSFNLLGDPAVP